MLLKACGAHRCIFDVVIGKAPSADKKGDSRNWSWAKAWRGDGGLRFSGSQKKGKVENPFEKKTCHHPKGCVFYNKNLSSKRVVCFFVGGRGEGSNVKARSCMCSLKRINSKSEVVNS